MARSIFGGGIADFVLGLSGAGQLQLQQATLTFWTAKTGGTQLTNLLLGADGSGGTVSSITTDVYGSIPQFQGPDGYTQMWAAAPGSTSRMLMSSPGAVTSGGGGTSQVLEWRYASGAWPTLPASKPAGVLILHAIGPTQPSSVPSWVGYGPTDVVATYTYAPLT